MSAFDDRLAESTRSLRLAFDQSFAAAPVTRTAEFEDFLLTRVGGDAYAIRLSEVAGLYVDRKIVPIPSKAPELLGIVGLRGTLAPIYDLRALLDYTGGSKLRWLVLARAPEPIGFAFDSFEAHLRLPQQSVSVPDREEHARRHVRGAVRVDGATHSIIHIESLLGAVARQTSHDSLPKER